MKTPSLIPISTSDVSQLRKRSIYHSNTELPKSYKNEDVQHEYIEKSLPELIKEEEDKQNKLHLSKETTTLNDYNSTLDVYNDLVTLGRILIEEFPDKTAQGLNTSIVPFLVASKIKKDFEGEVVSYDSEAYNSNHSLMPYGQNVNNLLIEKKDLNILGFDQDKTTVVVNPDKELEKVLAEYILSKKGDVAIMLREDFEKSHATKAMTRALQYQIFLNEAEYTHTDIKILKRDDNQYSFVVCGKN
jgi:hypothetical protein